MECKGRRTMRCCFFFFLLWRAHLRLRFLSLSVGTFLISLPRRSFSRHYSRPVEFSGGGGVVVVVVKQVQVKSSHKNGETKNKYTPTPPPSPEKTPKTTNESNERLGEAWGQLLQMKVEMNHRIAVWGPRRMVCKALSRTSYRHAVNYSPHVFPVLPSVGRETTRVQLWWLFQLGLKFSMFGDVLVFSFMAPLPSGICQSQNLCGCLVFLSCLPISICRCDVPD